MPFKSLLEQSKQAREKTKQFQEEAFQQRHNVAKRESGASPQPQKEPGVQGEGAFFI
jgi:hypothetical protein